MGNRRISTTLKIDVDKRFDMRNIAKALERIKTALSIIMKPETLRATKWFVERSRHDRIHIIVHVPVKLTSMQIVALQAICGSDYRREAFNFVRALNVNSTKEFNRWCNVLFVA
jgi:hypothetical protein